MKPACGAALVAAFLFVASAMAQEHHHPAADADIHHKFYSNWMRPHQPTISCCNLQDCAPAEAKVVSGEWWARHAGKAWVKVPADRIEQTRGSPDGRNHLCAVGELVFCFVAGAGI